MVRQSAFILFICMAVISSIFSGVIENIQEVPSDINDVPHQSPDMEILDTMDPWFTENLGQINNDSIQFYGYHNSLTFQFTTSGYSMTISPETGRSLTLSISFPGSNLVHPVGENRLRHTSNYFYGTDQDNWISGVPNYETIRYQDIYDGIDIIFQLTSSGLKYEFIVSPGADPDRISIHYEGCDELILSKQGDLNIPLQDIPHSIVENRPFSYQTINGIQEEVRSAFQILPDGGDSNTVQYDIGSFDTTLPLTIDPLISSSYFGGTRNEYCRGLAKDSENNIYVTGNTKSDDFPTTSGAYDEERNSAGDYRDVFVFKMNEDASELIYSTFVGGTKSEYNFGIGVDDLGQAFVTGRTASVDFPTTNGCYDDSHNGGGLMGNDLFLFGLTADGSDLLYSSYIGGSDDESDNTIFVDGDGYVYLSGPTASTDFPTTGGCYDDSYGGGNSDLYILKMNKAGSELEFSTYLGGEGFEVSMDILVDADGYVYITGSSNSQDFPTTPGCYDTTLDESDSDIIICKLLSDGSDLVLSTFIGGSDYESGYAFAIDPEGNICVTGETRSDDFPTSPGCLDDTFDGGTNDVVVFELDPQLSELQFSTYIGGTELDRAYELDLDPYGTIFISGNTESPNFPIGEVSYDTEPNGDDDCFLLSLRGDGKVLFYSTFFGGSGWELRQRVIHMKDTIVTMVCDTSSDDFPTKEGSYEEEFQGASDITISQFSVPCPAGAIDNITPTISVVGDSVSFQGIAFNCEPIPRYRWTSDLDGVLFNDTSSSFSTDSLAAGTHSIDLEVSDNYGLWSTKRSETIVVHERPVATIESIDPNIAILNETITLLGTGTDDGSIEEYYWRSSIDGVLFPDGPQQDKTFHFNDDLNLSETIYLPESVIITADYDAENDSRINKRWVDVETWTLSSDAFDYNFSTYLIMNLWYSIYDEGYDADPEFKFTISLGDTELTEILGAGGEDKGNQSTEYMEYFNFGNINIQQGEELTVDVAYRGWEDCVLHLENTSHPSSMIVSSCARKLVRGKVPLRNLSQGEHEIFFKVKDNYGVWSEEDQATVIIHERPVADIIYISPDPTVVELPVNVQAEATDDGSIKTYLWSSDRDGELYSGPNESPSFFLPAGEHIITLRVQDDHGVWSDPVMKNITAHHMPIASILHISPNPAEVGTLVDFSGSGTDDGTIVQFSGYSHRDEEQTSTLLYSGPNSSFPSLMGEVGLFNIALQVMDDHGVWSNETNMSLSIFIPNTRPSIGLVDPQQREIVHGEVPITGTFTDLDQNDTIVVEIKIGNGSWSSIMSDISGIKSPVQGDGNWSLYLESSKFEDGNLTILFRCHDGTDYSDIVEASFGVDNSGTEKDDEDSLFTKPIGPLPLIGFIGLIIILLIVVLMVIKSKKPSRMDDSGNEPSQQTETLHNNTDQSTQNQFFRDQSNLAYQVPGMAPIPTNQSVSPPYNPLFHTPPPTTPTVSTSQNVDSGMVQPDPGPSQTTNNVAHFHPAGPQQQGSILSEEGHWSCLGCNSNNAPQYSFCMSCGRKRNN